MRSHERQGDDADELETLADRDEATRDREEEHTDEVERPLEGRIQPRGRVELGEESSEHRRRS